MVQQLSSMEEIPDFFILLLCEQCDVLIKKQKVVMLDSVRLNLNSKMLNVVYPFNVY